MAVVNLRDIKRCKIIINGEERVFTPYIAGSATGTYTQLGDFKTLDFINLIRNYFAKEGKVTLSCDNGSVLNINSSPVFVKYVSSSYARWECTSATGTFYITDGSTISTKKVVWDSSSPLLFPCYPTNITSEANDTTFLTACCSLSGNYWTGTNISNSGYITSSSVARLYEIGGKFYTYLNSTTGWTVQSRLFASTFIANCILSEPVYTITVTESSYGAVSVDKTEASEGDTVTITVTPNTGQKLYRVFVVGDSVGTVETIQVSANVYTFTMPADNVKVSAAFMSIDPYKPGGDTVPQDSSPGTFDNTSDDIPIPDELTINYSDSGLIRLYNPDRDKLKEFGDFLWGSLIDYDTIKKAFASPMDQLISLHTIPIALSTTNAEEVKFGGIGSGVSMKPLTKQFYQVNMGTLNIPRYYGSSLDFAPFTSIKLYLPFVGERDIDTDEIMGKDLSITYQIDALTGACVAYLSVNGNVFYQFSGNVAQYIPLSQSNYSGIVNAIGTLGTIAATAAGAIIGGVGGAAAGLMAGKGVTSGIASGVSQGINDMAGVTNAIQSAGNLANSLTGKPSTTHVGVSQGVSGYMTVPYPYVIIKRPKQSLAPNFYTQYGYPANLSLDLSTLSGYCKLSSIKPTSFPGTVEEWIRLEEILKAGFYVRGNEPPAYTSTEFNVYLEKNASENNACGKALTTIAELSGQLRENSTVTTPTIQIEGDIQAALNNANMVYISQFKRRYFIREIETVRKNLYRLYLDCDVLQSFWDSVKTAPAILERYENQWTLDLNDPYFQVTQDMLIQCLKFTSSFMINNTSFVLAIAGNGGAII